MDETRTEQIADLHTVGHGAAAEKFAAELKAVLENIRDPNTEAEAKRKIVLEFTFAPNADREMVAVGISARSVFAATKPTSEIMFVGRQNGETVGTVMHGPDGQAQDPRQGVLPLPQRKAGEQ
jgi:hypothetical protein